MDKPTIAIDVDEVLFPLLSSFFPYLNATYGLDLKQENMLRYRTEDLTGETGEQLLAKMDTFLRTHHYQNTKPIDGSVEALRELHKSYRLVVVTARHKGFRGLTERFIEQHFPGLIDSVSYTHQEENPDILTSKVTICKELNAVVLIDDSLTNVIECAENGIKGILFGNHRWNQADELPSGVTRCKDWPAVLEYFKEKK